MNRIVLLAVASALILNVTTAKAADAPNLQKYLSGVPDVMTLNPDGEKYGTAEFSHKTHAAMKDVPCQTCHHQKGDAKPEKCMKCHNVGGEANEEGKKAAAIHDSKARFPLASGQKAASCIGCHKAENALLEDGKRTGKDAPTKCTACHKEKEG
jgi:Class III cytochrome C family